MSAHPDWVLAFLSEADLDAIRQAIAGAESSTSAEIRVHLERRCPGEPVTRAVDVFEQLGMHRTRLRHGVLLYVAVEDHRLAVVGDSGIHERVGPTYWRVLADDVATRLRAVGHADGIGHAVAELGATLARHFPRQPNDDNELSDDVSVR
jgi:uncharacterized membrane protein